MGWFDDAAPGHEGYLVGVVHATDRDGCTSSFRWRELHEHAGDERREMPVNVVQVACACGWRSPRLQAPLGTTYWPSSIDTRESFDDDCARLWRAHIDLDVTRLRLHSNGQVSDLAASEPAREGDRVMFVDREGVTQVGVVREQTSSRRDLISVAVPDDDGGSSLFPVQLARCHVIARHEVRA